MITETANAVQSSAERMGAILDKREQAHDTILEKIDNLIATLEEAGV